MEEKIIDLKTPKKAFSTIGFALCIYIAVGILVQLAFVNLPGLIFGYDNWYYNTTNMTIRFLFIPFLKLREE